MEKTEIKENKKPTVKKTNKKTVQYFVDKKEYELLTSVKKFTSELLFEIENVKIEETSYFENEALKIKDQTRLESIDTFQVSILNKLEKSKVEDSSVMSKLRYNYAHLDQIKYYLKDIIKFREEQAKRQEQKKDQKPVEKNNYIGDDYQSDNSTEKSNYQQKLDELIIKQKTENLKKRLKPPEQKEIEIHGKQFNNSLLSFYGFNEENKQYEYINTEDIYKRTVERFDKDDKEMDALKEKIVSTDIPKVETLTFNESMEMGLDILISYHMIEAFVTIKMHFQQLIMDDLAYANSCLIGRSNIPQIDNKYRYLLTCKLESINKDLKEAKEICEKLDKKKEAVSKIKVVPPEGIGKKNQSQTKIENEIEPEK